MANNESITAIYDSLPKIARIIIQIVFGWIVGGLYRIFRYLETKNTATLVVGLLGLIPPVDLALWIIDLVQTVTNDKISFYAD